MDSKIEIMTLGMLKKQLSEFEASAGVSDDTKIFLDTGWDSIQEIAPDALEVVQAREFTVEDEWTKNHFPGMRVKKKQSGSTLPSSQKL